MTTVMITITMMHHAHDHGLKHYHDEDMQSVALSIEGDVDPEKFMPWLNDYVQTEGASILRSKGILAFKNEPKRFVFQGVHMILDGDLQRDWKPGEKRVSRLVFIGRKLKNDEITKGFWPAWRNLTRCHGLLARKMDIMAATSLTAHVTPLEAGAPVTAAAFLGQIPHSRSTTAPFFIAAPGAGQSITAHPDATILVAALAGEKLVTGGDDGRVVAVIADGATARNRE